MPRAVTSPDGLRAPSDTDTPDVPRDIGYLADDVQKALLRRGASFATATERNAAFVGYTIPAGTTSFTQNDKTMWIHDGTSWLWMYTLGGRYRNFTGAAGSNGPFTGETTLLFDSALEQNGPALPAPVAGVFTFTEPGIYQATWALSMGFIVNSNDCYVHATGTALSGRTVYSGRIGGVGVSSFATSGALTFSAAAGETLLIKAGTVAGTQWQLEADRTFMTLLKVYS